MSRLVWDNHGEHFYETGVSHCAYYVAQPNGTYGEGRVWNGITSISENPTGAESTDLYADNIKYLALRSAETYESTIEAYHRPDGFGVCDGVGGAIPGLGLGQQPRKRFGYTYQTLIGNDTLKEDYGYLLHIVYGATASPSEKSYSTVNDSPEAVTFSWEINTTPVVLDGHKPTATVTVDSTLADQNSLAELMDILYGTDEIAARLPSLTEVIAIMGVRPSNDLYPANDLYP